MITTDQADTPKVYRRLGLVSCINASGHVNRLGGSRIPKEVTDAMSAGTNEESIRRLPDSAGLPSRIFVPPTPMLTWVHYARLAGECVVECKDLSELERLAAEQETAMFIYLPSIHGDGPLKLGEVINCARTTERPLMVDAAGSPGMWVKSAKG